MQTSTEQAQKKYRSTDKGKAALKRAAIKAQAKQKVVRISPQHKVDLIRIAKHHNTTQKKILENWIGLTIKNC